MVDSDPARQRGPIAWLWEALRLDGWRRAVIGLLPLVVPLLLALAHSSGLFAWSDARFFDAVTLREAGRKPQVVMVRSDPAFAARGAERHALLARAALARGASRVAFRIDPGVDFAAAGLPASRVVVARPVERVPGSELWRLVGGRSSQGALAGAKVLAGAEDGIHRRQLGALPTERGSLPVFESLAAKADPGEGSYLLRLTARQNLPRLDASQLIAGEIDASALAGAVILVEPPGGVREARVVTARAPAAAAMTLSEYSAAAIQTLADRRAARELSPLGAALLLAGLGVLAGLIYLRSDPKRILLALLLTGLAITLMAAWLSLTFANLLLPVTALLLAQPVTALLVLWSAELAEDRSLRRFVTQTINLSSRKVLLKDHGRLPAFLSGASGNLGIARSLIFEQRPFRFELLEAAGSDGAEIARERRRWRKLMARAQRAGQPIDAAELVGDWPGPARLAPLGPARGECYWLYGFESPQTPSTALNAAAALAQDYRAIQQLRADLSAGSDQRREYRPADEWAGGAVKLISDHSDRLGAGLDGLETAVTLFHPIGFPVMVNAPMAKLYEKLALSQGDTTLPELLKALTGLDEQRIDASVSDLLLHGGEFRVNCREIDTRARLLRVGAPHEVAADRTRLLIVELVDVSEPVRLAQLRLRVSNLLDVSLRNDLEAIGFATALARSGRNDPARLERALGLVEAATARATGRLEDVGPHLQGGSSDQLGQSFPIDAGEALREACELVADQARQLGVTVAVSTPEIGGFTSADPQALVEMVEAILRIVLADTAAGETVHCTVEEDEGRTRIAIVGGIGMAFERLYAALENADRQAPGPFRALSRGMAAALRWGAMVSYSTQVGKGYRFTIQMRRIG